MDQDITLTSLEILYSISRELAASLDLRKVLANILTLTTENMNVERASLVVLDVNGKPVDAAIMYNGSLISHTVDQLHDVVTSGLAGWVVKNQKSVLINNTQQDERWLIRPNQEIVDPARSALCVPLMAQEVLVGVLTIVHREVNFFTQSQFALQQAIADMAGIAIRNAQLYQEVENAHLRFRDLFDKSVDPIMVTAMDGKIVAANQKSIEVTLRPGSEIIGSLITDIQELPEKVATNLFEQIEKNESIIYEASLLKAKNEKIPVEVHVSTINLQGQPSLQWIFRDISERKNLDLLREDLSAMIYHDLRSPLANIISSLELMKAPIAATQDVSMIQLFEISDRATERMNRLISSLLDINRLEAGQPITNKKMTDVEKLMDEAIETLHTLAKSKKVVVEKMVFSKIAPILVDEDMIRRVLINLLENAIKFSSEDDKTAIGAKANDNMVTIWVEDHGPGIPPEAIDKIFNKFVRLHGNSFAKGLGLGLSFCRTAVLSHGGKIWVENVTGGGSRFILTLPTAANN
jgi:two-component system, NtrC family, sensor histidine kinase KinB